MSDEIPKMAFKDCRFLHAAPILMMVGATRSQWQGSKRKWGCTPRLPVNSSSMEL